MPTKYDGSPDSRAYHRFLTEGAAYMKSGQVKSHKQVFVLSHYLMGKAHEFYIREVAGDPEKWGIHNFFLKLFNNCFPVDFQTKRHHKLVDCLQRGRTVREYMAELHKLWNLISNLSEHKQVTKLWSGFQHSIQSELWKDKLNPEKSSLTKVIAAAEVIEIAHSVGGWLDQKHWLPSSGYKGTRHNQGGKTLGGPSSSEHPKENPDIQRDTSPLNPRRNRFLHQKQGAPGYEKPARAGKWLTRRLKLSKEDHDHTVEHKLCFICKKSDHFANQCPEASTIAGGSKGKPPGAVASYSVHVAHESERLRDLADSTERINCLQLGTCHLMTESFISSHRNPTPERMGDPLAMCAKHVLAMCSPYPRDDISTGEVYHQDRFTVYRVSETEHVISDNTRGMNLDWYTPISSHLLKDWNFWVGEWLANQWIAAGHEKTKAISREQTMMMSKAIAQQVEKILSSYQDPFWCGSGRLHHFNCVMLDGECPI